ncbi:MAG: 4-(cytidine 5'-diphospho)-2-C-methyl-D-erythritol kinase [Candidatus Limivicinus sp.]
MKDIVREAAYAKLNLTLDVAGKRDDGYHEMLMVMQTVSLSDSIELKKTDDTDIRATCNFRYVPTDGRNLAVRAAEHFCLAHGIPEEGIRIRIEKNIPVGAGMAGGSADAAAVLRGMNSLFETGMNRKELERLAEEIGSDVAFCVAGGTALARGRGEILEDLDPMPDCHIVICKPGFSISTPELFRKLDRVNLRRHPDTAGMQAAIASGDLRECAMRMYNVFEEVPDHRMRTVAEIKSTMRDFGALGAVMTGTGSAVFGVWQDEETAEKCAAELAREYRFCSVSRPTERLVI